MIVRVDIYRSEEIEVDDKFEGLTTTFRNKFTNELQDELENIIFSKYPGEEISGVYDLDCHPLLEY